VGAHKRGPEDKRPETDRQDEGRCEGGRRDGGSMIEQFVPISIFAPTCTSRASWKEDTAQYSLCVCQSPLPENVEVNEVI
jgi:hypothetical protein